MRKSYRSLANEAAHKRRKRIVAGHAKLVLNIYHRLCVLEDYLLVVVSSAVLVVLLVPSGPGRCDEVLKHANYVRFHGAGGDCGRTTGQYSFKQVKCK